MKPPDEILAELKAPFKAKEVHWRQQGKPDNGQVMVLAYIDARDVMKRLDDVVGMENWQSRFTETPKGKTICELSLRIEGEWITKCDGAGDTQVEADKGAISDAFKRAAVSFGIARYLYYLPTSWGAVNERGYLPRNFKGELPSWALPK